MFKQIMKIEGKKHYKNYRMKYYLNLNKKCFSNIKIWWIR